MKRLLVVLGILALIGLVLLSQQLEPEIPRPLFSTAHGPGDSLQPLSVVDCTPDTGYDFCISDSYGAAYAKLQSTYWLGEGGYGYIEGANRRYYVDEIYVNVKSDADKLYVTSTWDSAGDCGDNGCSGSLISDGKYVIASAPAKINPSVYLTAWEKFTSTTGQWWWTSVSLGLGPSSTVYVVDCYDENDCGVGEYCDISGSWETWSCKIDPCASMPAPENTCVDFDLWSQKCVMGEYVQDKVIESNSIRCGCVLPPETIDNICIDYDLWSQKQAEPCVNVYVTDELLEEKSSECGYVCTHGELKQKSCTDESTIVTHICINNIWIEEKNICPLNWINLEMILESYIEEIKVFLEELL